MDTASHKRNGAAEDYLIWNHADKRFDKLLTGLRTAVANEYELDKEVTSYDVS